MIFLMAGLLACEADQSSDLASTIGVQDEIILELQQTLSPEGQGLGFNIRSARSFACEGVEYVHILDTRNQQVRIDLMRIEKPDPCAGDSAKAELFLPMPHLQGTYPVTIEIGEYIRNEGELIIDHKGYRLMLETTEGMQVPNASMLRVPNRVIWGYVFHDQSAQQALNEMKTLIAPFTDPAELEVGYYGHFYSVSPTQITVPLPIEKTGARTFAFLLTGTQEPLREIVDSIRAQLPAGTEWKVWAWNGEKF